MDEATTPWIFTWAVGRTTIGWKAEAGSIVTSAPRLFINAFVITTDPDRGKSSVWGGKGK